MKHFLSRSHTHTTHTYIYSSLYTAYTDTILKMLYRIMLPFLVTIYFKVSIIMSV